MGYEDHLPKDFSKPMRPEQERERRASIKAILADDSLTPLERRRSIQHLMDGRNLLDGLRRASMNNSVASSTHTYNPLSITESEDDNRSLVSYGYNKDYAISNAETKRAEENRPPCHHYQRNCTIIAPCCGAAFGCRICHDDCDNLPPPISNAGQFHRSASLPTHFYGSEGAPPGDTQHNIDRFLIREVICRNCFTRQSSKTNECNCCGVQFGAYHCDICNLWMSDAESPYHCEQCGFCRVGGVENFLHCNSCGMCIDRSLYDNHNCKDGKYKANCPICQEYLFSSRSASHEMPCGHAIHWECFRMLATHDSRCPVCKKTAETRDRMLSTWESIAAGVARHPVPPELARVVNITCNDCEKVEDGRAWHYLGIQCHSCSSFNTVVNHILLSGEEAHEYLENRGTGAVQPTEPRRQRASRRSSIV